MSTSRKNRLAFLVTALIMLLSGTALLLCRLYKVIEPAPVFMGIPLDLVLIAIGGVMGLLAPKIWRVRKRK